MIRKLERRQAESGEIKERKRRQDLLVEAFYTATKAKEPLKLAALPGSAVDSRSGYRANAFRLGLELARLGRAFSTALAKIPADDRSFSAPWNSTISSIDNLVSTFSQRGLPGDEILEAYRAYLINQFTGQRCAETKARKGTESTANESCNPPKLANPLVQLLRTF